MNCGLVKLNPRWKASKYEKFYKFRYDSYYRGPQKSLSNIFDDDLNTKGELLNERLSNLALPNKMDMLDVGGGTGFSFFSIKKDIQINAYIIEPSDRLKTFLIGKGIRILEFDQAFNGEILFDLIISRHTLEHTINPIKFLKKIHGSLTDDGFGFIVVPNAMYFNENKSHSFFRHVHTYYFNIYTFSRMCEEAGFNIVKVATGGNESGGNESEIWAILRREGKSSITKQSISPKDQLGVLLQYAPCSRLSPIRKIKPILKRILY